MIKFNIRTKIFNLVFTFLFALVFCLFLILSLTNIFVSTNPYGLITTLAITFLIYFVIYLLSIPELILLLIKKPTCFFRTCKASLLILASISGFLIPLFIKNPVIINIVPTIFFSSFILFLISVLSDENLNNKVDLINRYVLSIASVIFFSSWLIAFMYFSATAPLIALVSNVHLNQAASFLIFIVPLVKYFLIFFVFVGVYQMFLFLTIFSRVRGGSSLIFISERYRTPPGRELFK